MEEKWPKLRSSRLPKKKNLKKKEKRLSLFPFSFSFSLFQNMSSWRQRKRQSCFRDSILFLTEPANSHRFLRRISRHYLANKPNQILGVEGLWAVVLSRGSAYCKCVEFVSYMSVVPNTWNKTFSMFVCFCVGYTPLTILVANWRNINFLVSSQAIQLRDILDSKEDRWAGHKSPLYDSPSRMIIFFSFGRVRSP